MNTSYANEQVKTLYSDQPFFDISQITLSEMKTISNMKNIVSGNNYGRHGIVGTDLSNEGSSIFHQEADAPPQKSETRTLHCHKKRNAYLN